MMCRCTLVSAVRVFPKDQEDETSSEDVHDFAPNQLERGLDLQVAGNKNRRGSDGRPRPERQEEVDRDNEAQGHGENQKKRAATKSKPFK